MFQATMRGSWRERSQCGSDSELSDSGRRIRQNLVCRRYSGRGQSLATSATTDRELLNSGDDIPKATVRLLLAD